LKRAIADTNQATNPPIKIFHDASNFSILAFFELHGEPSVMGGLVINRHLTTLIDDAFNGEAGANFFQLVLVGDPVDAHTVATHPAG